jgi:formate dehydrogenase maturation protein FdhE
MSGRIVRGLCGCGKPAMSKGGRTKDGNPRYASGCSSCRTEARKHKKDYCEHCGETNKLEIDHIDGNRSNNHLTNLQTLCKSCHIIKTVKEKDNIR